MSEFQKIVDPEHVFAIALHGDYFTILNKTLTGPREVMQKLKAGIKKAFPACRIEQN